MYIGRFVINADEKYSIVISRFAGHSFHVNFFSDPVNPKFEVVIGPMEKYTLDQWLEKIRATGCKFHFFVADWEKVKNSNYFL